MSRGRAARNAINPAAVLEFIDSITTYEEGARAGQPQRRINGRPIDQNLTARTIRRWQASTKGVTVSRADALLRRYGLELADLERWAGERQVELYLRVDGVETRPRGATRHNVAVADASLNEQQIEVLRWIGNGCPDGVMEGYGYRISASALRARGLATVNGRGPNWRAELTAQGRRLLERLGRAEQPQKPRAAVTRKRAPRRLPSPTPPPKEPAELRGHTEAGAADPRETGSERPGAAVSPPAIGGVQKLAYNQEEAAAAIGVSRAWFRRTILPELAVVRRGRRTLIPVKEVARWLDEQAEHL